MTGEALETVGAQEPLLRVLMDRGTELDVAVVERLVALQERSEDRAAARSIHVAIAEFQSEVPSIAKTKEVDYPSRSGVPVRYSYAPLDVIADTIREPLHAVGLSYTWDSETGPNGVECVCTVRHVDGGQLQASFTSPLTDESTKMSGPQRTAAALTYARRQSLIQALGLTSTDTDTDAEDAALDGEPIDVGQRGELTQYITESGADLKRFLDLLNITTLEELDRSRFEEARDLLRRKLARKIADDR